MRLLTLKNNNAQATTELAIMGAIVIMVLAYLLQQGYIYNCRQALEMYTFRKALQLSRNQERGISLTVMRDVISPSFFTGLNRQKLMASASIEHNPWVVWVPKEGDPEDVSSRQLLQVNEGMIRKGCFLEIPPTKVKIDSGEDEVDWMWTSSAVSEIDPQTEPTQKSSQYTYQTQIWDTEQGKTIDKNLETKDTIPLKITFEDAGRIIQNYYKEDWKGEIKSVEVGAPPQDITLILEETVRRQKNVQTPH